MGIRSFLRGNGDHGSLARGDATRLMPSAGGAGRFPGPPPRAAVGGANFPDPPPPGRGSYNPKSSPFYNPAVGGVGPTFTQPPLGGAPGGGQSSRPAGNSPIRPNPHGVTRPNGEW